MPTYLEAYNTNGVKIFDATTSRVLRYIGEYKLTFSGNGEIQLPDDRNVMQTYYRLKANPPFPISVDRHIALRKDSLLYVRDNYIEFLWYKRVSLTETLGYANASNQGLVEVYTY